MSWDKLIDHKNYGDMGFKDLMSFNVAMLGQQRGKFQNWFSKLGVSFI